MPGTPATPGTDRGGGLRAAPARHPGRWVATAVVVVLAAMFVNMVVTNRAFNWSFVAANIVTGPILGGVRLTVLLTVVSMVIGLALGVLLAVMRLSASRLVRTVAFGYTWFFRSVPRLVLCVLFGNIGILFARIEFGVPFDRQIGGLLGVPFDGRFFGFDSTRVITGAVAAALALGLSEAAYMAEIARAGILSVDSGQAEAAQALGMTRPLAFRRVVLPQALRVIVPPTGNEVIAMLKDTSLVAYVPAYDLFFQTQAVGTRSFQLFPMLVAATLWYLALTTVLLVGQYFVERRFGRGFVSGGRGV